MNNPEYVKVNDKKYKINTDFKIALKVNEICMDSNISDIERTLAFIYLLFGDDGLDNQEDWGKLIELGQKYLSCGKKLEKNDNPDMDFVQDMDYIETSFMSDYGIDLSNTNMHWWKFFNLINGLSNSEMGNCCILNRIRNLRNYDISTIKDSKEKKKIQEAQKMVALNKPKNQLTKEQEESCNYLENILKGV